VYLRAKIIICKINLFAEATFQEINICEVKHKLQVSLFHLRNLSYKIFWLINKYLHIYTKFKSAVEK